MKRLFFFLFLGLIFTELKAQNLNLEAFNAQRFKDQRQSMTILGSLSAANLAWSGISLLGNPSAENRAFHEMNAAWGGINLTIAALGYWGVRRNSAKSFNLAQSVSEHHKTQRILWFNTGLDFMYVMGGALMLERAKSDAPRADYLRGAGKAVMYNGGLLLLFDLGSVLYAGRLNRNIDFLVGGNSVGMTYRF